MNWTAIWVTCKLATLTSMALLVIGLPIAYWLTFSKWRWKFLVESIVALPLVLPPTVLGFYILVAIGPHSPFGRLYADVVGQTLPFSFQGLLIASILYSLPFAVQPLQRAFEAIPVHVREAAWVSGLSPWTTFVRVELPLAWPGLVSALALVFAHTLGEFGVILMVGGSIPGETQTLSIAIYDRVQAFRNAEAAWMAFALLAFSLSAILLVNLAARRRPAAPEKT